MHDSTTIADTELTHVVITGHVPNRGHSRRILVEFRDVPTEWLRPHSPGAKVPADVTTQEIRKLLDAFTGAGMSVASLVALARALPEPVLRAAQGS